MAKRPRKRRPGGAQYAYYIRRKSALDDSQFFCGPAGERVYFARATWVEALLPAFGTDQYATCVRLKREPGDISFQEWVAPMLPEGVQVETYLAELKQIVRSRRRNRGAKRARIAALAAQLGGR